MVRPTMPWMLRNLARRGMGRLRRELSVAIEKARCRIVPTFVLAGACQPADLPRRFAALADGSFLLRPTFGEEFARIIRRQATDALAHRFDLLGSGPVIVAYCARCQGLEGHRYHGCLPARADAWAAFDESRINARNRPEAKRIWDLVQPAYIRIDWQRDFKSGYRWHERTWHRDIGIAPLPGVDIKVPWELARCQHLPALALACHFARAGSPGFDAIDRYAAELRNQVLDFIANNPPGFGVNWACTMDVAIRAANLLVAHDIALSADVRFDDAFEAVFAGSIFAHGRHVVANLEWWPQHRGNHYLANIAGLLFIAAYLPHSEEVDAWLAFAAQELLVEVAYQFHDDGSNFEASTCYHRLSAEMVLWACALLEGLPPPKQAVLRCVHRYRTLPRLQPLPPLPEGPLIPEWVRQRLARMADFTRTMTRPDGLVVQFGDNDSGRFITLGNIEQVRCANSLAAAAWSLDHSSLVAGIEALLGVPSDPGGGRDPAAYLLRVLARADFSGTPVRAASTPFRQLGDESAFADCSARHGAAAARQRWTTRFTAAPPTAERAGLLTGLQCQAFPGMGCYVFRSPRLYLAIRCGEIGIAGLGAHAHCDQLGIELVIDGRTIVRDPGTYIYTPLPERRNAYRSAAAHHVPRVAGREPADLDRGIFDLRGAAEGECLYFGPLGFVGRHRGYGAWVYRQVALSESDVAVNDLAEGNLVLTDPTPVGLPFSPGYGRLQSPDMPRSP